MKISAVIFDLNGTILEDEDEYGLAFNKVLKGLGVETGVKYPHVSGIGVKENWPILLTKYHIKTDRDPSQLEKETQEAYLTTLTGVTIRPGFENFVKALKDSGIKIALATSNTREVTDEILDKVNLRGLFEIITTSEEVKYNKPDPDIFLVTADKLGVERGQCLVIEDTPAGVVAAHRAGMKVIAIARDADYAVKLSEADLVVEAFSEISLEAIDQL